MELLATWHEVGTPRGSDAREEGSATPVDMMYSSCSVSWAWVWRQVAIKLGKTVRMKPASSLARLLASFPKEKPVLSVTTLPSIPLRVQGAKLSC